MAGFVHGSKAVLKIGDDVTGTGTLQDISDALNESGTEQSVDTAEVTAFGDTAKEYIAGLEDGNLSLSGHFKNDANKVHAVLSAIKRKKVDFEFYPEGTTTGNALQSGVCILTSYSVQSSTGDRVTVSASFQVSGGVTESTAA